MSGIPINSENAPAAIGTYSQGMIAGGFAFISGQIPLDPATMTMIDESFDAQVRQVISNLEGIVNEAGATLADVVKFTVYLTDLGNFEKVNAAMQALIPEPFPARAAIEVSALPKDALVEIDAIVALPPT